MVVLNIRNIILDILLYYTIFRYGSCDWIRPDMGVAQCFIGTPRGEMMGASR